MKLKTRKWKGDYELEVKRLSVPGYQLEGECPACGASFKRLFEDDYLSFPPVGRPFKEAMYCGKCEHEWDVALQLDLELTLLPSTLPEDGQ